MNFPFKLRDYLSAESKNVLDWCVIAGRVNKGEFNDAPESALKSIRIGLRGIDTDSHPHVRAALKRIEELL